jgi:hypothetical protein
VAGKILVAPAAAIRPDPDDSALPLETPHFVRLLKGEREI